MAVDWDRRVLAPLMRVFGDEERLTFAPAIGAGFPFDGIFDDQYRPVSPAQGVPVDSAMPVVGVRLVQFASLPLQGDQLTRSKTGVVYVVKDVQPDGKGWALLLLNEAP